MGIADVYYNIEDKWYDFLDFLDSKRIPVYKVVDPIENAGVPTLPVFVALLLIAGYFVFSGVGGAPAVPATVDITVEVSADGSLQPDAGVAAYADGTFLDSGSTDAEGKARLKAVPGAVTLVLKKPGCTDKNETITVSETKTYQVRLVCQAVQTFQQITVVDQDGKPLKDGRAIVLAADNTGLGTYNVVDGVLKIPNVTYDRINLLSNCLTTGIYAYRNDLILNPSISVNCRVNTDQLKAAEGVSLTVNTYYAGKRVSDIPVYLAAEGGAVLRQKQYTVDGSTTFTIEKYKDFLIKTEPTSVYDAYASAKMSVNDSTGIDITVSKGIVSSTLNLSDNSTKKPLSGVRVTILDGGEAIIGKTISGTSDTFSLSRKDYTLVLYKEGYVRQVATLRGGDNRSLYLQPADVNNTGSLGIFVYDAGSGTGLSGISVDVLDEAGVPIGMGAALTDFRGEAFFSGLPAMRVKPVAYKSGITYKPSPESLEIKAGQSASALIPIPLRQFNITVTVLNASGNFVQNAYVYLYDFRNSLNASASSDVRGRATFTALENRMYHVVAERYDSDAKTVYRTQSQKLTITSDVSLELTLRPISANATFLGIYEDPNLQDALDPPTVLGVQKRYYAKFEVGLLDTFNESTFEISADKKYLVFSDYAYAVTGTNIPAITNTGDKLTITWKNYTAVTETLAIPIYALNTTSNTKVPYKVAWKRGSTTASTGGTITLNITGGDTQVGCTREKNTGLCYTLTGDKQADLYKDFSVRLFVQYEGYQKLDQVKITGRKVEFNKDPSVSRGSSTERESTFINITGLNMSAGDSLEINVTVKANKTGKTDDGTDYPFVAFSLGGKSFEHRLNITGKYKADVTFDKSELPCDRDSSVKVTIKVGGELYKGSASMKVSGDSDPETFTGGERTVTVKVGDPAIREIKGDEIEASPSSKTFTLKCPGSLALGDSKLEFTKKGEEKTTKLTIGNTGDKDKGDKAISVTLKVYSTSPDSFTAEPTGTLAPFDVEPGEAIQRNVKVTANTDKAETAKLKVEMTYGSYRPETGTVDLVFKAAAEPQPVPVTPPTSASLKKVLNKQALDAVLGTPLAGRLEALRTKMKDSYTGVPLAMDAVSAAFSALDQVSGGTGKQTNETSITLNFVRINATDRAAIKSALCARRYPGTAVTEAPCSTKVLDDIASTLLCGTYSIGLKVTYKEDLKSEWRVTKVESTGDCVFKNAPQFAGFTDDVDVSSDGLSDAAKSSLGEKAASFLNDIWGIPDCKHKPATPPAADACELYPVKLMDSGDNIIVKQCSGTDAELKAKCTITEPSTTNKLEPTFKASTYNEKDASGNDKYVAAAEVSIGGTNNLNSRLVIYVKKDADVDTALKALSGLYNDKPTVAVVPDPTNLMVYYISAQPAAPVTTAAALANPDFSDTNDKLDDGKAWEKFATPIASCSGTSCITNDVPGDITINGEAYVSSGMTGYCGDAGIKQAVAFPSDAKSLKFSASAYNKGWGGASGIMVGDTWLLKFEGAGGVEKTWGSQQYAFDLPAGVAGTTKDIKIIISDQDAANCNMADHAVWVRADSFSIEKTAVAPPPAPSGKTLMDLVTILNKACITSEDNSDSRYGSALFVNQGRPIVIGGPASYTWAEGAYTKKSTYASSCKTTAVTQLDENVWNALTGGLADTTCPPYSFKHDAVGWEMPIVKDNAYKDITMQAQLGTYLGVFGVRHCNVRTTLRPTIEELNPPATVISGSEFIITLRYKAGFQSSGAVYLYLDDGITLKGSTPAASASPTGGASAVIPVEGITADGGTKTITVTLSATKEGKVRYRARDNVWRLYNPLETDWKYDWLRFPESGETTADCLANSNEGNANCAAKDIQIKVYPEGTATMFDAATTVLGLCSQSKNDAGHKAFSTTGERTWVSVDMSYKEGTGAQAKCKPISLSALTPEIWETIKDENLYQNGLCTGTPKAISEAVVMSAYGGNTIDNGKAYSAVTVTYVPATDPANPLYFLGGGTCTVAATPKT